MAPLTHIYLASKASNSINPYLVVGSVIPDIAWTSLQKLAPERIHNKPGPETFHAFIADTHPRMSDLAVGVLLHSNERGGDYYSHQFDNGYSYRLGQSLIPEVAELLGFEKLEDGKNLSHNLIEAGLDLHIHHDYPETLALYHHALQKIDQTQFVTIFDEYMHLDTTEVAEEVARFKQIFGPNSVSSAEAINEKFLLSWIKRAYEKDVDPQKSLALIKKAQSLTASTYKSLLKTAITTMQKDFKRYF